MTPSAAPSADPSAYHYFVWAGRTVTLQVDGHPIFESDRIAKAVVGLVMDVATSGRDDLLKKHGFHLEAVEALDRSPVESAPAESVREPNRGDI